MGTMKKMKLKMNQTTSDLDDLLNDVLDLDVDACDCDRLTEWETVDKDLLTDSSIYLGGANRFPSLFSVIYSLDSTQ
jgi:hypothetical protein